MFKAFRFLKYSNKQLIIHFKRSLSATPKTNKTAPNHVFSSQVQSKKIGPFGWFLLVIPASTFALGTWQIQRKKWKEDLIAKLYDLTHADPIELPENLDDLQRLEYRPIHVRGEFLHDKELYMGPRTFIVRGDSATKSQLMSSNTNKTQGYLVITPLKLSDREETILVNRGWVPAKFKQPHTREKGQVKGEVDVVGIVRLHENRPQFSPQNQEQTNLWFYRDLYQMAKRTGAEPILLDATTDFDVPAGPIGGQTRITLRNEHLSYVLTWYSLCGFTSFLWYKQFLARVK